MLAVSPSRVTVKLLMRSAAVLATLTCGLCLGLAGCGDSSNRASEPGEPGIGREPLPAPGFLKSQWLERRLKDQPSQPCELQLVPGPEYL